MPAAALVAGGSILAGIYSSNKQASAARNAQQSQTAADQAAQAQQQANFEKIQALLAPYNQAGTAAINAQGNLAGINGSAAQNAAIQNIQASPYYTSQLQAGENALLQNASATGGLRGGNVQRALGQFAPSLLAQAIQQQYTNLGNLTNVGQNAAAGTGTASTNNANAQSQLYQAIGNAGASGALAQGQASQNLVNSITGSLGAFGQLGGFGNLGSLGSSGGVAPGSLNIAPLKFS